MNSVLWYNLFGHSPMCDVVVLLLLFFDSSNDWTYKLKMVGPIFHWCLKSNRTCDVFFACFLAVAHATTPFNPISSIWQLNIWLDLSLNINWMSCTPLKYLSSPVPITTKRRVIHVHKHTIRASLVARMIVSDDSTNKTARTKQQIQHTSIINRILPMSV